MGSFPDGQVEFPEKSIWCVRSGKLSSLSMLTNLESASVFISKSNHFLLVPWPFFPKHLIIICWELSELTSDKRMDICWQKHLSYTSTFFIFSCLLNIRHICTNLQMPDFSHFCLTFTEVIISWRHLHMALAIFNLTAYQKPDCQELVEDDW